MNRRSLITLASVVSLAVWHKPIINSVVLPAHAQTSCTSILSVDILGNWLFTDAVGNTVEIEFISESQTPQFNAVFSEGVFQEQNQPFTSDWQRRDIRNSSGDHLTINARPPLAPWRANITQEDNCIASEITIVDARSSSEYTAPLVGVRI